MKSVEFYIGTLITYNGIYNTVKLLLILYLFLQQTPLYIDLSNRQK